MILNIRTIIHRDNNNLSLLAQLGRGDIYNNLHNILALFYNNPNHSLESVAVTVSYLKPGVEGNRRYYVFLLQTNLEDSEQIMSIVYFIEHNCKVRGIEFDDIDRLMLRLSITEKPGDED